MDRRANHLVAEWDSRARNVLLALGIQVARSIPTGNLPYYPLQARKRSGRGRQHSPQNRSFSLKTVGVRIEIPIARRKGGTSPLRCIDRESIRCSEQPKCRVIRERNMTHDLDAQSSRKRPRRNQPPKTALPTLPDNRRAGNRTGYYRSDGPGLGGFSSSGVPEAGISFMAQLGVMHFHGGNIAVLDHCRLGDTPGRSSYSTQTVSMATDVSPSGSFRKWPGLSRIPGLLSLTPPSGLANYARTMNITKSRDTRSRPNLAPQSGSMAPMGDIACDFRASTYRSHPSWGIVRFEHVLVRDISRHLSRRPVPKGRSNSRRMDKNMGKG